MSGIRPLTARDGATEIGRELFVSPKTVECDRQPIIRKLGLRHRVELVRYALDTGLRAPGQHGGAP